MRTAVALGSNLGDRLAHLRSARTAVMKLPGVSGPEKASSVYETEPVNAGPNAGPFLNAVLEFEYHGQPLSLLDDLQRIEASMGRPSKRPRNASRTIDLDLLYVGNLTLTNEEVVIPHPRLHLRRFVLAPLAELRPDLMLPGQERNVSELLKDLRDPARVEVCAHSWEP